MHIKMRNAESLSQSQISEFLKASGGIEFAGQGRAEVYGWVQRMLVNQEYARQARKPRGAIRAYLSKVTGLSLAQITRLIRAYSETGVVEFYTAHLNGYLNYHRPCGFATVTVDRRGKRRRQYKSVDYATPYEKLKSLAKAEQYLKPNGSFEQMDQIAKRMSDTASAKRMGAAKAKLLRACQIESPFPPRFR